MRTRVLFNQKGGVGKSSLTVNLAAIAASQGQRTLIIDLDTQCNSSGYLNVKNEHSNIADLFRQSISFHIRRAPAIEFCQDTGIENLSLIAGSPALAELESELHSRHKIYKLREAIDSLSDDFDQVYIDTAPAMNFYSLSALIAADRCLIPIDCDDFARQGLYRLQQRIDEIREDHNPKLEVEGIIANQFIKNAKLPGKIVQELIAEGYPVLPVYLNQSVKMRESHQQKQPLITLAPKHPLTQSLIAMYQHLQENK